MFPTFPYELCIPTGRILCASITTHRKHFGFSPAALLGNNNWCFFKDLPVPRRWNVGGSPRGLFNVCPMTHLHVNTAIVRAWWSWTEHKRSFWWWKKKYRNRTFPTPASSGWMHIPKSGSSSLQHSSLLGFKAWEVISTKWDTCKWKIFQTTFWHKYL